VNVNGTYVTGPELQPSDMFDVTMPSGINAAEKQRSRLRGQTLIPLSQARACTRAMTEERFGLPNQPQVYHNQPQACFRLTYN
jgi:hypothetical protein